MPVVIENPTRILFFTGKGGVGKTSSACSTAIGLADRGKRVLLVSTDPASNLDEMLNVSLGSSPTAIPEVPGLFALNIDPESAARSYRERVVGPYRGLLPPAAVQSMEEQLSGACTTEIAAFDEFTKLLGDASLASKFHNIVFDTAPTGHTLRLLELPAAWTGYIETNIGGASCLGPLSGLTAQKDLYASSNQALRDASVTTLILVARPDRASLAEADRTREELTRLGILNLQMVINGVFKRTSKEDPIASAMERNALQSLDRIPEGLQKLPTTKLFLLPFGLVGIDSLRKLGEDVGPDNLPEPTFLENFQNGTLDGLVKELSAAGKGVIMTMGKGGVGKTTLASKIASQLAKMGHDVLLTTTDPAAHLEAVTKDRALCLHVERIDPQMETAKYRAEVLTTAGKGLDAQGYALLEEDLRSPCTEEIAVFRAFAQTVAKGEDRFVVVDTAPTGHTLLLLDAAESYHREVLRKPSGSPDAVQKLSLRLRDKNYTKILLVTIAEATPIHEAMQLEKDLARAEIRPHGWVVNQSLTPLAVSDPVLLSRKMQEADYLTELSHHASQITLVSWDVDLN